MQVCAVSPLRGSQNFSTIEFDQFVKVAALHLPVEYAEYLQNSPRLA